MNALTGELRWQISVGAPLTAPVQVHPGAKRIFAATEQGKIHCLDLESGRTLWTRPHGAVVDRMALAADRIVVSDQSRKLTALDLEKSGVLWEAAPAGPVADTSVNAGQVYVATADGRLSALDCKDGSEKWSYTRIKPGSPVAASADGYAILRQDSAVAFIGPDGKECWTYQPEATPRHLACLTSRVILSDGGTTLVVLDRASGKVIERRAVAAEVSGMEVSGGLLLAHTADGAVHAFGFGGRTDEADDREGYLHLASILEKKGTPAEAIEAYRLILTAIDPDCGQALDALAKLYEKAGQPELAKELRLRMRRK